MLALLWATIVKTVAIVIGIVIGCTICLCILAIFADIFLTAYEKFSDWRNRNDRS